MPPLVYDANAKVQPEYDPKMIVADPARSRAPYADLPGARRRRNGRSRSPASCAGALRRHERLEAGSSPQRFLCGSCPHLRPQIVVARFLGRCPWRSLVITLSTIPHPCPPVPNPIRHLRSGNEWRDRRLDVCALKAGISPATFFWTNRSSWSTLPLGTFAVRRPAVAFSFGQFSSQSFVIHSDSRRTMQNRNSIFVVMLTPKLFRINTYKKQGWGDNEGIDRAHP